MPRAPARATRGVRSLGEVGRPPRTRTTRRGSLGSSSCHEPVEGAPPEQVVGIARADGREAVGQPAGRRRRGPGSRCRRSRGSGSRGRGPCGCGGGSGRVARRRPGIGAPRGPRDRPCPLVASPSKALGRGAGTIGPRERSVPARSSGSWAVGVLGLPARLRRAVARPAGSNRMRRGAVPTYSGGAAPEFAPASHRPGHGPHHAAAPLPPRQWKMAAIRPVPRRADRRTIGPRTQFAPAPSDAPGMLVTRRFPILALLLLAVPCADTGPGAAPPRTAPGATTGARREDLMERITKAEAERVPPSRSRPGESVVVLRGEDDRGKEDFEEGRFRQRNDFAYLTGVETPARGSCSCRGQNRPSTLYLPPGSGHSVMNGESRPPRAPARRPPSARFRRGGTDVEAPGRPLRRDRRPDSAGAAESGSSSTRSSPNPNAQDDTRPEAQFVRFLREGAPDTTFRDLAPIVGETAQDQDAGRAGAAPEGDRHHGRRERGGHPDDPARPVRVPARGQDPGRLPQRRGDARRGSRRSSDRGRTRRSRTISSAAGGWRTATRGRGYRGGIQPLHGRHHADLSRQRRLHAPPARDLPARPRRPGRGREAHEARRDPAHGNDGLRPRRTSRRARSARRTGDGKEHTMDHFFIHGLSHYLGMDVHDVGDTTKPMQTGEVFTIEPGIYIQDENLGVRIEDDYLMTARTARQAHEGDHQRPGRDREEDRPGEDERRIRTDRVRPHGGTDGGFRPQRGSAALARRRRPVRARRAGRRRRSAATSAASSGARAGGAARGSASRGCRSRPSTAGRGRTCPRRSPRWRGSATAAPTTA